MGDLGALLVLVEALVLSLRSPDHGSAPRAGILFDAGAHFLLRARVEGGPDLVVCYQVLYHSLGRPLRRLSMEKRTTLQSRQGAWAVGILETLDRDPELARLFHAEHMSARLFRAFASRGYTDRAALFHEDTFDRPTVAARGPALWETHGEGASRYALPVRTAAEERDALRLATSALADGGVYVVVEADRRHLAHRPGAVALVAD